MELFNLLVNNEKKEYKCFDILKNLLNENKNFRDIIEEGFINGKIYSFTDDLWNKIHSQNIRRIDNFETVFKHGANIGFCTVASKQLSYSLDNCLICGGVVPILVGTPNSLDGSHTWILHDNKIIDTTLMLIIDVEYANKIGYIEENRYDPCEDPLYMAAKEFTLDKNIKK